MYKRNTSPRRFNVTEILASSIKVATYFKDDKTLIWYDERTKQFSSASYINNFNIKPLNFYVTDVESLTVYPPKRWIIWTSRFNNSINIGKIDPINYLDNNNTISSYQFVFHNFGNAEPGVIVMSISKQ